MTHHRLSFAAVFILLCVSRAASGDVGPRLASAIASPEESGPFTVWVDLTDKGSSEVLRAAVPRSVVTERSLIRRAKVRPGTDLVDYGDLPVEQRYVDFLAANALAIRHTSKWFNAVSLYATREQIARIAALPFVKQVELLARYGRARHEADDPGAVAQLPPQPAGSPHALDYGTSFTQVSQINVPAVHDL